jgi:hypothetical protein
MGKTSRHDAPRENKKSKKDIQTYLPFSDNFEINDENEEENENEYRKEEYKLYINETATILRQKILNYVDKGPYSLCEYLDIDNVENYLSWLLCKN